ncbi:MULTISPECIES: hypothetical protein [Acinetobacter]|uniref:Helix-turn-helix domain-containing protein n=1 Tax=Acinetobacter lwoffii TaxID=28090 RepID=A0A6N1MVS1_ACILW|nr:MULTISPECIES: hypothetical protein [Acinetobacter]ENX30047.1 hypothetical protein F890_01938 [Acinetobacter sp. CIP 64.7]MCU4373743.1 hypothetical protein [Acinetobacter variabilis]QKU21867.1 hypothetical protein FOB19_10930 [Acinetobacter lwoffii]
MTVDDLRAFYNAKSDAELARILGRDRSVINYWRKGIPLRTQAVFEISTKGKLKANIKNLGV